MSEPARHLEDLISGAPDAALPPIPGITPRSGFAFRKGQHRFLLNLAEHLRRGEPNHLGVFVPGYGKTITALASFVVAHHLGIAQKLVVFVPRGNLRDQYADPRELNRVMEALGAPRFSFCVADSEKVFLKNIGTRIVITTYQYAGGRGGHKALDRFCRSAPCMFVFDEVHHLADDGHWAEKIEQFPCACTVALSGTPLRSDNKTLFGVPFEVGSDGEQYYVALHEVGLRDAHEEGGILKRVEAHVIDYRLRMVRRDTDEEVELSLSGMMEIARTSKEVDAFLARKKLRFHDVYLESLLGPAFLRFAEKRRAEIRRHAVRHTPGPLRTHQMLVIAMSNRHAEAILSFIHRRFPQFSAERIGQDVPARDRKERLDRYRNGETDVMVQVDMIGEGTDIKPISVIVKADLVRAYSKTLQQVFRGMRYFDAWGADGNVCDIYAANDSDIVGILEWISSEQQIGIKLGTQRAPREAVSEKEATPSRWELKHVEQHRMKSHALELFPGYGEAGTQLYLRELHQPPPAVAESRPHTVDVGEHEKRLRKECAALASELAFALGAAGKALGIRDVHAEAKRRFGKGQNELSLKELEQKRAWLERCLRNGRLA